VFSSLVNALNCAPRLSNASLTSSPLEQHVFQKVRDAVDFGRLVPGARANEEADRRRHGRRIDLTNQNETVR